MNTEKPTAEERIHHPYSPSSLQSREACACYASAFTGSEAAEMGTKQHNVADSGEDDASLPDEKAIAAVECIKFVEDLVSQWPGCTVIKEEYLQVDDEVIRVKRPREELVDGKRVKSHIIQTFKGSTAGYLDVGLVSADQTKAKVADFKFGQVAVETASNNVQGIAYGLGLWKRFPTLEEFEVIFISPHRDEVSRHTFYRAEFPALLLRIKTIVQRAVEANKVEDDFTKANPTVGACLFCSRIGRCPRVAELALKLGKKYSPLTMPDSISTSVFLDPADAARGIKFAQVIKAWCEAFRTQATAKSIDDPKFMPDGFKVVQMQKRKVVSAIALGEFAKTHLPVEMHASVERLYDIAIGPLEKLISTAAPRGNKERAVEYFGEGALAAGLMELGEPYAFLRQDNAK